MDAIFGNDFNKSTLNHINHSLCGGGKRKKRKKTYKKKNRKRYNENNITRRV